MTLDVYNPDTREVRRRARVWLDGEEVTTRCYYASAEAGIVGLYRLNAEGKKYCHPDDPPRAAKEQRTGHVLIQVIA